MSPDGTTYVAYQDRGNNDKVSVMRFDGDTWGTVGSAGFSSGAAYFVSLAFAPDATPYVAYSDYGNGGKATVKRFNGVDWVPVGNSAGFSGDEADYTSLAIAPDGTPYVAYSDLSNTAKATVMKYSGNEWIPVGSAGFSGGTVYYTSLAFVPDGTPYVAYQDGLNGTKATVMKFGGVTWDVVGAAGFSAGTSEFTSLAFAPNGTPYLAYADYGNDGKATVMQFSGTAWVNAGSPGFSVGEVGFTSLAIAPGGAPYVAYSDYGNGSKATVMKNSGGGWGEVANAGFSAGLAGNVSLAFSPSGLPTVAYSDAGNSNKATVMRLINPPTINGIPNATATVGVEYRFAPTATNATRFSITGTLPSVYTFDISTGVFTFTPETVGTYGNIVITATNSFGTASLPAFTITVFDTAPPDTAITGYPANPTTATSATFTFTSPEGATSFECQLDGGNYGACNSGAISYSSLAVGSHTFNVRAKNVSGNADATPASYSWNINSAAPTVVMIGINSYVSLAAALSAAQQGDTVKILATITPEVVNYRGTGLIILGGGYDGGWNRQQSVFSSVSSLTVTGGTLIVDQLVVK
jgi:hypothetical protein